MLIAGIYLYAQLIEQSYMTYWDFLTDKYVLSTTLVILGAVVGYGIRNYYLILGASTFTLIVYCMAFAFDPKAFLGSFFLAMYTVFLGSATVANIARHFKEWILNAEQQPKKSLVQSS